MNEREVIDLVSLITAYDGRNAGEAELHAWSEAAKRGRWTYADAVDAVNDHFSESTAWLMPGHVTQRIRSKRSEPPRSNALPQASPRRAQDDHRDRVVEWFAERTRVDRDQRSEENRACLAIECPHCTAKPNRPCVQTTGPRRPRAGPLPIEIPHLQRRKAYRQLEE